MSTNDPMTQEELDAIHARLGCDNSTTDDVCTLLDEVERLRALPTVDDAMVERVAEAIYLRCFLRCNSWATEAKAKASLEAAKADYIDYIGYIGGWKAAYEDARAALHSALNNKEEA